MRLYINWKSQNTWAKIINDHILVWNELFGEVNVVTIEQKENEKEDRLSLPLLTDHHYRSGSFMIIHCHQHSIKGHSNSRLMMSGECITLGPI